MVVSQEFCEEIDSGTFFYGKVWMRGKKMIRQRGREKKMKEFLLSSVSLEKERKKLMKEVQSKSICCRPEQVTYHKTYLKYCFHTLLPCLLKFNQRRC